MDQSQQNEPVQQVDQPDQPDQVQGGSSSSHKSKILSGLIVILAVVCVIFSIVAMNAANTFFSFLFSLTTQLLAKQYLYKYYSGLLGLTYLAILGFVIAISNTAVYFTKFNQKQRLVILHVLFYLTFLICGIIALGQHSDYTAYMQKLKQGTSPTDGNNAPFAIFQVKLAPQYIKYRGQVTTYFIGYCICFFLYGVTMFYVNYNAKRQQQQADEQRNPQNFQGQSQYSKGKSKQIIN